MGKLFYVMGASGVGKDSLLKYAREHIPEDTSLMFAHRYITRPADAGGENHVELSMQEFAERDRQGCFAMRWESHDNCYGVGIEINQWLENSLNVVVNGSRSYLTHAAERYQNIVPILICADRARLAERLIRRGREEVQQVQRRLALSACAAYPLDHPSLVRIENNGDLPEAGKALVDILTKDILKKKEKQTCI